METLAKTLRKNIACALVAAMLVVLPGPSVTSALAQVVSQAPAGISPIQLTLPVAGLTQNQPLSQTLPDTLSLPAGLGMAQTLPDALQEQSARSQTLAELEETVPAPKTPIATQLKRLGISIKYAASHLSNPFSKESKEFKKKRAAAEKQERDAGMTHLADRLEYVDSLLTRIETDAPVFGEAAHQSGRQAWENGSKSDASAEAVVGAESADKASGLSPASARQPVKKGFVMPSLVLPISAATTFLMDMAARTLMPQVFGFAISASVWTTFGLGGLLLPALIAVRAQMKGSGGDKVQPLRNYADTLIGTLLGAAASTFLGLHAAGLSLIGAFTADNLIFLGGPLSLAAFMGLSALAKALPVIYASANTIYGLENGRRMPAEFTPLQLPMKILVLQLFVQAVQITLGLMGLHLSTAMTFVLPVLMFMTLKGSAKFMTNLTHGRPAFLELEDWIFSAKKQPLDAAKNLRKTQWAAALATLAVVACCLGLLALHQGSLLAGIALLGTKLLSAAKSFGINILLVVIVGGILPRFMGAKPEEKGPFVDMLQDLAKRAGMKTPPLFHGDGGKKGPNAFAAGMTHRSATVTILDPIGDILSPEELKAVLGHELSHIRYRHMLTFFALIPLLFAMFGLGTDTLFQLMLAFWGSMVWLLSSMKLMRANEDMADAGSAALLGDTRALATGLRKMGLMGSLGKGKAPYVKGNWFFNLFLSHPDLQERVHGLASYQARPETAK
ncbi:MAG: M48 family metalloprotease [Elusimicrobiota bacterium]|jgi:heat shock protein HtpX